MYNRLQAIHFKQECSRNCFCEYQTAVSMRTQTPHVGQAEPDLAKADALW